MASRCSYGPSTLVPFLYPSLTRPLCSYIARATALHGPITVPQTRLSSTVNDLPESRLNPAADDYISPTFTDQADLTLYAGRGGNGCVSFLREAYMPDGPPNGGDGGVGGNIFIQAAHGETSLHKIARRRIVRAGRGKHGQGSARGGTRGEDIVITVPVGTIVRELERQDPAAEEAMNIKIYKALQKQRKREQREELEAVQREAKARKMEALRLAEEKEALKEEETEEEAQKRAEEEEEMEEAEAEEGDMESTRRAKAREEFEMEDPDDDPDDEDPQRHKWLLYPGMTKADMKSASFPGLPKRTRHLHQPAAPIYLDLSRPTPEPILLATGGIGGLGNPHFTSRIHPRPIFATKGDDAVTMKIALELKLIADVGLVGLPNAGKSTLLRAITNSRTRVGNWAFTTLQPNIGTVVLDKYSGRPSIKTHRRYPAELGLAEEVEAEPRTRFTVADIPGLIEGAHLDRGLGIAFLRHVERANVLAFVVDLGAGNAVKALNALWREVGLYAQMREDEEKDRQAEARVDWDLTSDATRGTVNLTNLDINTQFEVGVPAAQYIAGKPWFVVATKADLPETQDNFKELKTYLESISSGEAPHPSGVEQAWTKRCMAVPVSAINGQGVDRIVHWTVGLLDE